MNVRVEIHPLQPAMPAVEPQRSILRANRFLLARRATQIGVILLFLLGPWAGIWILRGNLSSSELFGTIPMSDPFVLAQTVFSGHVPEATALIGVALVAAFYALMGGRVFCAWVCPVNMVTDFAAWLRKRFNVTAGRAPSRHLRLWLLATLLAACALTGTAAWETVNPVSHMQRALIFGALLGWGAVAAVFVFDLLISPRGWCGHVCPAGALYGLMGSKSLLRVSARHASRCDDCAKCYAVCPEPQVIAPALKGKDGHGPAILESACTNCGRCIDVCAPDVFVFTHRFDKRKD
jgi:ferredoxin-type protein NapH